MKSNPQSPLCYTCKFRENVPGDAHSCCNHPAVGGDPLMALIDILANCKSQLWEWHGKRISHMSLVVAGQSLNIIGNPHGVANGWFFWPANFDPIWLQNCDGYEEQK